MKYYLSICFTSMLSVIYSQVTGDYTGTLNGDAISISLIQNGEILSGSMSDSRQNYAIDGRVINNVIDAKAVEPTMGLTIVLSGSLIDKNAIQLKGDLLILGIKTPSFNSTFTRKNIVKQSVPNATSSVRPKELQGKAIDPNILGRWREESHYSSGYGSNFSGSTYTYLTLHADHTMSDDGSVATVSGTNYSGQSSGLGNSKIIPNVWYYTTGNIVMVVGNNNGNIITEKLGTYYIENGKMLITHANSQKKTLYYRD